MKAAPSGASLTLETGATGTAGGDIRLLSEKNTFDDVTVRAADAAKGIDGTIQLKTTAPNTGKTSGTDGLTVTFGEGADGSAPLTVATTDDITIENIEAHSDLNVDGKLQTTSDSATFTTGGNLNILETADLVSADEMTFVATGDTTVDGTVTAAHDLNIGANGTSTLNGTATANNVNITSGDDANVNGTVTAKSVTVDAGGDANVAGTTKAANDLLIESTNGDATLGGKASAMTATVKADHDAKINGLAVVTDVTIAAGNDATLSGAAVNGTGEVDDVTIVAGHDANIDGLIAKADTLAVAAKNDVTIAGLASTTDMTIDAGRDADLGGLLGTHDVRVNAGKDIVMDGAETFRTDGVLSLTAGNDIRLGATKNLAAGSDLTLRAGSDITLDSAASTGGGNVLTSSGGKLAINHIGGGTTKSVLAIGDRVLSDAIAANSNVNVLAYHGMDIGNITSGGNATIDGLGAGDITVRSGDVTGTAYIRSNIAGDLAVSNFRSGGMARYTTRGGNMTLENIYSDHRIGIWNYGRDKTTDLTNVKARNLISYLAFHLNTHDGVDAPVVFNILTAGDPARRAIGWRTAGDTHHHLLDAAEAYRFRRDWQDVGTFLTYEPLVPFLGLPGNAGEGEITIEEANGDATM